MEYDIILFDMDGVMTGELSYWKTAALTVWEYLYHEDAASIASRVDEIFDTAFCNRAIIQYAKRSGVNTNYDLAYVTAALAKGFMKEENPFQCVKEFFQQESRQVPYLYDQCARFAGDGWEHEGTVWQELHDLFQSWYLGDGDKKKGLIQQEEPLFSPEKLRDFLSALKDAGIECGIGTGRPREEILPHLKRWGLLEFFEQERIVTQTEVVEAQAQLHLSQSLSKPHFYLFGKGVAGLSCNNLDVIQRNFDQELVKKTLVVGDAGADIYAARNLGADFAAVLTGVNGQKERPFFEQQGADYIFDDVFGLINIL